MQITGRINTNYPIKSQVVKPSTSGTGKAETNPKQQAAPAAPATGNVSGYDILAQQNMVMIVNTQGTPTPTISPKGGTPTTAASSTAESDPEPSNSSSKTTSERHKKEPSIQTKGFFGKIWGAIKDNWKKIVLTIAPIFVPGIGPFVSGAITIGEFIWGNRNNNENI